MKHVEDKIISILQTLLSRDDIYLTSRLKDDLLVDSVQFIQMIVVLEKELDLSFSDSFLDYAAFYDIQSVVDDIVLLQNQDPRGDTG